MIRKKPNSRAAGFKTSNASPGKQRITVSLSKDKVRFLKAHSQQSGAASVSAYIERLLADAHARAELGALNAHTAQYYDSIGAEEGEELSAWARLGESALAFEEE